MKKQNFLLTFLLIIITLFTAFYEGYLTLISLFFWGVLILGFFITLWLSLNIATNRFLALIVTIFIIEYFKETIGMGANIWKYHGFNGFYNFGIWAWVLGGLSVYTLATKIVIKKLEKINICFSKYLNFIILVFIIMIIPLTLGNYKNDITYDFIIFYVLLSIFSFYAAFKMKASIFIGIVITAWLISNPSEYAGSVTCKVWTFTYNPYYPPFFLLFGCWPLEILSQYLLSAFLANEPL